MYSLDSHLELAAPFQVLADAGGTALESFELDARWRFKTRESKDDFQPLLRAAFHQAIQSPWPSSVEVIAVGTYGPPEGLHLVLNLGAKLELPVLGRSTATPTDPPAYLLGSYSVAA